MLEDTIAQLQREAEERQDELLALLAELVAFPTVSPPARNTLEAQRFVERWLQACGFETELWEVYPGDPIVTARRRGTQSGAYRSLLLNGHIDVAEVGDGSEWPGDPFRLRVENGRAYGRGTADMKGGLAALLFALKLLHEAGVELKGDVLFQSVIGEEAGEAGTLACTERGGAADFAVVADTSALAIQGQGGVITGWVTVNSPVTHHDGMRYRMIHAGGGVEGASAIEKMAKLIAGLQELERHWAVTKSYPGFPPGSNTINPAVIEGGRHAAFVADQCALWITVHFYPDEDYESVAAEIEEHLLRVAEADPWLRRNPPVFRWGGRSMLEKRGEIFPSLELDPDSEGVKALSAAHVRVRGARPDVGMSPTVTDAGWLGRAGIPAVIYGPGKLREAHAVNESVELRELIDYAKVMIGFIAEWCNRLKAADGGSEQAQLRKGRESSMERFSEKLYRSVEDIWEKCHQHPFLVGLRDGTLEPERFVYYMKQDYVYLIDYAKMFAFGSLKARDLETMSKFSELLHSTLNVEMELHRQYAERFGITREELEATEPSPTTVAYTKYMLDTAASGSLAEVVAALLPCMWSYRETGTAFAAHPGSLDHPLYREWILMYSSDEFGALTDWTIGLMDRLAEGLPERELARLESHFVTTSKFEYLFWDMAYRQEEWPV